jgi:hypothetical protein
VQHVGPYVSAPAFQRGAFPDAWQVASLRRTPGGTEVYGANT